MSRSDIIDLEKQHACKCLMSCELPLGEAQLPAVNEIRKGLMEVKWQMYDALVDYTSG